MTDQNRQRVYIAAPYIKGDQVLNVRNAIVAGDAVLKHGHVPFIPHLTAFWHLVCPSDPATNQAQWYQFDLEWVKACDALVRLPGESGGADAEVSVAIARQIPVFHGLARFFASYPPVPWPAAK